MTSQTEVLFFLEKRKKPVTIKQLVDHFGIDRRNMTKKVKKLNYYGYVNIIVDGRTYKVSFNNDKVTKIE